MARARPNPRLVKIHRSYTVEEVADLLDVHRNTVRAWIKLGLPTIDRRRPALILGRQLVDFLRGRRAERKRPCEPHEIYCVRCREPRVPMDRAVRFQPLAPGLGNLVGICPTCHARMHRRVREANLERQRGLLTVLRSQAQEHIAESPHPSANSDFEQDEHTHAGTPS